MEQIVFLINPLFISDKLNKIIYDGINTYDIDNQIAEICVNMLTTHPMYTYVAGNILVSQLHKKCRTNGINNFVSKKLIYYHNIIIILI